MINTIIFTEVVLMSVLTVLIYALYKNYILQKSNNKLLQEQVDAISLHTEFTELDIKDIKR